MGKGRIKDESLLDVGRDYILSDLVISNKKSLFVFHGQSCILGDIKQNMGLLWSLCIEVNWD